MHIRLTPVAFCSSSIDWKMAAAEKLAVLEAEDEEDQFLTLLPASQQPIVWTVTKMLFRELHSTHDWPMTYSVDLFSLRTNHWVRRTSSLHSCHPLGHCWSTQVKMDSGILPYLCIVLPAKSHAITTVNQCLPESRNLCYHLATCLFGLWPYVPNALAAITS